MEDHSGANNLKIRQRIFGRSCLQFAPLLRPQEDIIWAGSRHSPYCHNLPGKCNILYVSVFMEMGTKSDGLLGGRQLSAMRWKALGGKMEWMLLTQGQRARRQRK